MKKQLLWVTMMLISVFGFTSTLNAQDAAVTANPYAYGVSSVFDADAATLTVKYSLNAPAVAVSIDIYNGETIAKSFPLEAADLTAGEHSVAISTAELPTAVDLAWKIKVTGATLVAPSIVTSELYKFWSPYGIAVDNNPLSANFGRILVTETQMNVGATGYHTSSGNGGVGCGVYAFDPAMQPIKNASGGYGFTGGLTFTDGTYPGGSYHLYGFKRLATSEDGRIFVSNADMVHSPIYEINPADLNSPFTPLFSGTTNAEGIVSDETNPFIAGPNAAMTVMGKGADLKIAALSCKGGFVFSTGNYYTDVYNLGENKTWTGAPSSSIDALTAQYTVSPQGVNICYDKDGGLWYTQYRATPKESEPAIKHFNAAGVEDYSDITTVVRGGGIAFNMDKSLLAIPAGNGYIGFYTVGKDAEGKVTLTEKYKTPDITTNFRGQNAMAFDYAGNLYTCDNGKEFFGRIAMPREDPNAVTPAADNYKFNIPAPKPVSPYSLTQDWAVTQGLTGAADVRQGVNIDGKWYLQNKTTGKVEVWTKDGKQSTEFASADGSWPAICSDDAGNLIVRIDKTWPGSMATDAAQFRIFQAPDFSKSVDLKIDFAAASLETLPRMDFMGHARGNLLSADGGVLYLVKNGSKQIYNIPVAEGIQDVDNTYVLEGPTDLNNTATVYAKGDDQLIICQRNVGNTFYKSTIANEALESELLVTPDKYSLNGCGLFTLGGKDYIVYGTDQTYLDGFAVALLSADDNNQVLATHASQLASKGANNFQGNWFGAKAISDTQAKIYQYFPGGLIAEYTFTAPEPEVTEPSLKQEWISTTVPAAADTRQGIVKNGKWYIQNKADKKVEVWTKDGKSADESYATDAAGTGICQDEAGNIIIAPVFANTTTGYASVIVIPADGSAAKVIALTGMPIGRCDFFGYAKGNILSEDGGKLYLTTADVSAQKSVYVLSLVNGAQDVDNCFSVSPTGLLANSSTAIYSFTAADGEEHLIIAPRGTAASYLDATWNGEELNTTPLQLPGKHSLNGCAPFVMGGKTYIVYPSSTSSKYLDGFSIAEYSTDAANVEIVRHEETVATATNSFQGDWFYVEVVSDTKANIYQYYPGGFFALYTFKMPLPTPPVQKAYLIGQFDENAAGWAANAGLEMTPAATEGVFTSDITYKGGTISVATKLGANATDWDGLNANRFGPEAEPTTLADGVVSPMFANATAWGLPVLGKYTIEVNIPNKTIKATLTQQEQPTLPEKIYVIGNIPNVGWDPSVSTVTLEKTGVDGEYAGTFDVVEGDPTGQPGLAFIAFSKAIGANAEDWTSFNSGRFGSTNQNELLVKDTAKEFNLLGDKTYTVAAPASVSVKANLIDHTITLLTFTGVEGVDGSVVKVIAGVGEINIVGEVKTVAVYNAGGALISKDQKTINCASGMYLVKVNGKTVKVIVK